MELHYCHIRARSDNEQFKLRFQISTSVLQENTIAVLTLCVITPRDRITVRVGRDIMEMDGIVVNQVKFSLPLNLTLS